MQPIPFLPSLAVAAILCVRLAIAAPGLPDLHAYRAQDLVQLRNGFSQPPPEARPWVYWFWWNSVVSREEIARELEELAAAGFGGAELRVVTFHGWGGKPLAGMDAASLKRLGHRQLVYLSDEWLDTMEFTCATAERLGLRFAINLGQGWPPGGPWITDEHRTRHLSWKSMEVTGPGTFLPEVEQGDYCLPEAAWAARTTGKPIISCEAFTHLHQKVGAVRRPHGEWESHPAALRGAAHCRFSGGRSLRWPRRRSRGP